MIRGLLTWGDPPKHVPNAGPITLGNRGGIDVVYSPHYLSDEYSPSPQYALPSVRLREGCRTARKLFHSNELSTIFSHLERYDIDRIVCAPNNGLLFGVCVMRGDELSGFRKTLSMNELTSGDVLLTYDPLQSIFMLSRDLTNTVEHELWHVHLENDFPRLSAARDELRRPFSMTVELANALHHFSLLLRAHHQGREAFVARDIQLGAKSLSRKLPIELKYGPPEKLFHLCAAVFLQTSCVLTTLGDRRSADRYASWLTDIYMSELESMKPGRVERLIESAQAYAQRIASTLVDDEGMITDDFDAENLQEIISEMSEFRV